MEESNNYVKRSQRDYTLSFKINVVKEIELGELSVIDACRNYGIQSRSTVVNWLRKFGKFDWENQTRLNEQPKGYFEDLKDNLIYDAKEIKNSVGEGIENVKNKIENTADKIKNEAGDIINDIIK